MKKLLATTLLTALLFAGTAFSQNKPAADGSLLDLLGGDDEVNYAANAFKGDRVINNHSIEMLAPGTMDFRILHRFDQVYYDGDNLRDLAYNAFGIDGATMRMSFDFGICRDFSAGIARSTNRKELDVFAKYRLLRQSSGAKTMPLTVIAIAGATRKGQPRDGISDGDRLAYFGEVLIGRKFSESFSLQLAPLWLHQNAPESDEFPEDLYAASVGARMKITKRMALVADYTYAFNRKPEDDSMNPLAIGLDIETGGHVFQLHFSNSEGMNERAMLADANTDWWKGEVRFGFNLSRMFQLKKQKID